MHSQPATVSQSHNGGMKVGSQGGHEHLIDPIIEGSEEQVNLVNILMVDIDDPTLLNTQEDLNDSVSKKSSSPNRGGKLARRINSPRTLEAMAILGLSAYELEPIPYESVV